MSWQHIPLPHCWAYSVFVRLRSHHLEMPSILIIQVSRHVGHANLIITCCPAFPLPKSTAFSTDPMTPPFCASCKRSNQSIKVARAVSTRPQQSSGLNNAPLITGQASHKKPLTTSPPCADQGRMPISGSLPRYLERVQP